MEKEKLYVIYGEHAIYYDLEDNAIDGDRFYINHEELTYDEDGHVDKTEQIECFIDELFLGDDEETILFYDEMEGHTEFTNGFWEEDSFETLEEAIAYLKQMEKDALTPKPIQKEVEKTTKSPYDEMVEVQQMHLAKLFEPQANRSETYEMELEILSNARVIAEENYQKHLASS